MGLIHAIDYETHNPWWFICGGVGGTFLPFIAA
jgi:hypothetical protein